MKTVIIATGENPEMAALTERRPVPLLPLVDRPFVEHIVVHLAGRGLREIDFLLSHMPEKFEALLGDGSRWGARFAFHLARDAARPFRTLKALRLADSDEPILLGFADRLPPIEDADRLPPIEDAAPRPAPTAFCWRRTDRPRSETADGAIGRDDSSAGTSGIGTIGAVTGACAATFAPTATLSPTAAAPAGTERSELEWTGWAIVTGRDIDRLPDDLDERGFEDYILSRAAEEGRVAEIGRPLALRSYGDLIEIHRRVLNREFDSITPAPSETGAGIWLSRGLSIHPTARLIAPVYIGENCRIAIGAQIGPGAFVGDNCMLDARCQVVDTVIAPGSYVGEALDLDGVIVDQNRLINTRLGADLVVPDNFILGSVWEDTLRRKSVNVIRRLLVAFLLAVVWPLLAATALGLKMGRTGPVVFRRKAVRLPARHERSLWETYDLLSFLPDHRRARSWIGDLFLNFLPGLINVVRGDLSLVGLPARGPDEIAPLPEEWREFYLSCRAGLVNESDVIFDETPTGEEAFAAEVYYSVKMGVVYDLKLLARYAARVLMMQRRGRRGERSA